MKSGDSGDRGSAGVATWDDEGLESGEVIKDGMEMDEARDREDGEGPPEDRVELLKVAE